MSRTVKTPRVRCAYCGSLVKQSAVKRCRDGTYRCPRDAGLQSVRGKVEFRTHKLNAIYEAAYPSRAGKIIKRKKKP